MSLRFIMRHRGGSVGGGGGGSVVLPGAGAPQFRMGVNVRSQTYYAQHGVWRDLGRSGRYATPAWEAGAVNSAGWRQMANADSGSFNFVQELRFGDAAALDGNYVIWIDAPAGVSFTLNANSILSNIVQVSPQRVTCTVSTAALRAQIPDTTSRLQSSIGGAVITINVTNASGAAANPVPHMARADQEAGVLAGLRFDDRFIADCTTTSRGPNRPLWPMGAWEGFYGENADDLPKDTGHGQQDSAIEYSGGGDHPLCVRGSPGGKYWSPEACAEFWERTGNPIHLCFPAMMSDAAYDAWFARFLAFFSGRSLPDTYLILEPNNEPWNDGGPSKVYLSRQYGITFRASIAESISTTYANWQPRCRNHAHAMHRMILRARAVPALAGKWVAVLNVHHVNIGNGIADLMLNYAIPEFGGVAIKSHPELRLSSAPYYRANIGQESTRSDLRAIIRDRWYIDGNVPGGGSAATYWRGQYLTQITSLAADVAAWNSYCVSSGFASTLRLVNLYEGMTTHDVVAPRHPDLVGTRATYQALVYQTASGGRWVPANATIDGVAEDHSAETVASWWETGDLGFATRCADNGIVGKGFFVKLQNGGLNLFSSRANYTADTPITPTNGTTVFLTQQTRYSALLEFVMRTYLDDPAQTVNNAMRTAMRNAGVTDVALYSLSQYETAIDNWCINQDYRAFAVEEHVGKGSEYLTWAKATAP